MGKNEANHTESRRENWKTPQNLFDALDSVFNFKFDLCADSSNAKTDFFATEKMDLMSEETKIAVHALTEETDYLWINPPYKSNGGTGKYVGRAVEIAGPRGLVALVPASVGSLWWKRNVWAHFDTFIFPRRFSFEGAGANAKFDCAVCVKSLYPYSDREKLIMRRDLEDINIGQVVTK